SYHTSLVVFNDRSLCIVIPPPHESTVFPYTTLFRSFILGIDAAFAGAVEKQHAAAVSDLAGREVGAGIDVGASLEGDPLPGVERSEEHTSELQSRFDLVCRLLLENKQHRGTDR